MKWEALDLAGSIIYGSITLLILISVYFFFSSSNQSTRSSEITQSTMTSFSSVIDYDFSKIGYRVTSGAKIVTIDSTRIFFMSDLNNNGTVDSVKYYTTVSNGETSVTRRTTIGTVKDWKLKVNKFYVAGLDSIGNTTYTIANIKSVLVKIILNATNNTSNPGNTIGSFWQKRYFIKN